MTISKKTDAIIGKITRYVIGYSAWGVIVYILYNLQVALLNGYANGRVCFFGCSPVHSQLEMVIMVSITGFAWVIYMTVAFNRIWRFILKHLSKYEIRRKEKA